jgi:cation transporter-like permease
MRNRKLDVVVLNPLTGLQDPPLASLIQRVSVTLPNNQMDVAAEVFKELLIFSRLVTISLLTSILCVLCGGILAFVFPSLFVAFLVAAGTLSLFVSWVPTFYAKWVCHRKGVPPNG